MANRNWASGGKLYSMHVKPVLLDCNFVVDSTNGNGLGIRNLKGPGIKNVFMHTTQPPLGGNPNPQAGTIVVQMQDNYNRSFSGFSAFVSPVGASSTSSPAAGIPAVITVLGTATLAQWQAVGVPVGYTPAVGLAFISSGAALIGGLAQAAVNLAAGSGIDHIETVGNPQITIAGQAPSGPVGAQFILNCYKNTVLTAPTDGAVISLAFYLSDSSITVQGE